MSDASQLEGLKMESKTTLKASDIHIHDFSFSTPPQATVADDMLDRIAEAARSGTQTSPSSTIKMDAVDIDFDGLRVDLGDEGPEAAKLREAKRLVNQEEFRAALGKLHEVLEIVPEHHEAIYLQAYCHFKLNDTKAALETLLRLQGVALKNRMRTRVQSLKTDIRGLTLPVATKIYAHAVKHRQADDAIVRLRQFAETDPELGKFHVFLAGVLAIGRQMLQARQAALHGLNVCETDREELDQLRLRIEQRLLPELLGPARDHFRRRNYQAAMQELAKQPPEVQQLPVAVTFNKYLKQITGGAAQKKGGLFSRRKAGGLIDGVAEIGTFGEQKDLFEFLVAPEMKNAREATEKQDFATAERELTTAISCTPPFTTANHMLATCIYKRVAASVKNKIGQDLDEAGANQLRRCREQLDDAHRYAALAAKDLEIPDARRLVQSIDELRRDIDRVVNEFEERSHDAQIVNRIIDDFIKVLLGIVALNQAVQTRNAFQVRSLATDLYSNLQTMRSDLPGLRRRCKTQQAREIIDVVKTKFVDPNYNQLRRVMP